MSTIAAATTDEGGAYSSKATDKIWTIVPSSPGGDYLESDICQISRHKHGVPLRMLPIGEVLHAYISANDMEEEKKNHFKHTASSSPPNAAQSTSATTSADVTYLCCLHEEIISMNPADDGVK